jgi:hypothetical protein
MQQRLLSINAEGVAVLPPVSGVAHQRCPDDHARFVILALAALDLRSLNVVALLLSAYHANQRLPGPM